MGWERRPTDDGAAYFYRTVRVGHTVRKVYYGRGEAGHAAAAALERGREGRLEARKLLDDARSSTDEADELAAELRAWADVLLDVWLILSAQHKHRGGLGSARDILDSGPCSRRASFEVPRV